MLRLLILQTTFAAQKALYNIFRGRRLGQVPPSLPMTAGVHDITLTVWNSLPSAEPCDNGQRGITRGSLGLNHSSWWWKT